MSGVDEVADHRMENNNNKEAAEALVLFKATTNQPSLAELANDRQNVHTGAVNLAANEAMDCILKTPVPEHQCTLQLIWAAWDQHVWQIKANSRYSLVRSDIARHAKRLFIYNIDSHLDGKEKREERYEKLLNAVVAKIEASEYKDELYLRLWEECSESVIDEETTMCFQGHMSRLCNVFAGFDSSLPLLASRADQLQAAFQELASDSKLSVINKIVCAYALFDKFSIVEAEVKEAWLGAILEV